MPRFPRLTARRWLLAIFLVGTLHATSYALIVPPWQAPDEPGHVEYACVIAQRKGSLGTGEGSLALEAEIIASLARSEFWARVGEPWPDPLPSSLATDPFLVRSGRQLGDEPPAYYWLPSLICRLPWSIEARLRLIRFWGALLFGLTGVVAAWGLGSPLAAERSAQFSVDPSPVVISRLVPLAIVLLPMPAFIAGSANNDALAMMTATAVFAATMQLLWRETRRASHNRQPGKTADSPSAEGASNMEAPAGRFWLRLLGLLLLVMPALLSKKTNLFLVPWIAIVGPWIAWRRMHTYRQGRRSRTGPVLLLIGLAAAIGLLLITPSSAPSSWRGNRQPLGQGRIFLDTPGPDQDRWAARVIDQADEDFGRLFQSVTGPTAQALRGKTVEASAWVRGTDGQPQAGRLTVRDAGSYTQVPFAAGNQWVRVSLTHTVAITTTYVKIAVAPGTGTDQGETGTLLVDGVSLREDRAANLLRNASFTAPAHWAELLVVIPLEQRWQQFAPRLEDAFTPASLRRYGLFAALTFPGFWGNFGWLQVPLPLWLYALLALICLVSMAGLVMQMRRLWFIAHDHRETGSAVGDDRRVATWYLQVAGTWLLAVALIAIQTFLPMVGRPWQPQGRYLFPALLPIVGLLVLGLDHWLNFTGHPNRRLGLAAVLLIFAAFSLLSVLMAN